MTALANLPALTSAEVNRDPHAFFRTLRELPYIHQDGESGWYLVSRYDECAAAFKDPRFTSRNYEASLEPLHGRTILQMEGSEHAQRRSLVNPFLRGKGLDGWMGVIAQAAGEVLDEAAARAAGELAGSLDPLAAETDLVAEFTNYYPINVVANMLGLPLAKHDDFHRWYVSIVAFLSNFTGDPEVDAAGRRTQVELAEYVLPLVVQRRGTGGTDMISRLADAEIKGDSMSDLEVKAFVSLLLTAGGETTDKSLATILKNLLTERSRYEAVCADRSLIDNAIAETLRFSPPTYMTMRQTGEDVEVRGTMIPADSKVLLINASANRDEAHFADPNEFRLVRDDLDVSRAFTAAADHLAFGGGRHFCVGAQLAKAELETALNLVCDRFPGLRLVDGYVPEETGIKTRGPIDLRVHLSYDGRRARSAGSATRRRNPRRSWHLPDHDDR